jgi:hypothetical protein
VGQGAGGVSIGWTSHDFAASRVIPKAPQMNQEFNHAANNSPRSGSSKHATPALWCAIVVTVIAIAIWFAIKA